MRRLILTAFFVAHTAMFAQVQTSVITGRILGADGQPAAGVRVAVVSPNENGKLTSDTLVSITATDETGHYRMESVPPGRYGIIAGAVGSPTFYPGTAKGSLASILTIARGSTTAGVDFPLVGSAKPQSGLKDAINQVFQVQITTQPDQTILGRVVVDGPIVSRFLPDIKISFSRTIGSTNLSGLVTPFPTVWSTVRADGSFKLELEPAGYTVSVARTDSSRLGGFVVKSITLGSQQVNGAASNEIVVTLTPIPENRPIK